VCCLFGCLLVVLVTYVRYRQVAHYLYTSESRHSERVNKAAFGFGLLVAFGITFVANFPVCTTVKVDVGITQTAQSGKEVPGTPQSKLLSLQYPHTPPLCRVPSRRVKSTLFSPPLSFPSPYLPSPFPLPPLRRRPLKWRVWIWGRFKLPTGVWGGALAKIAFGAGEKSDIW